MAIPADSTTPHPYPAAIVLATFSFLVILLIIPPMLWHYRSRNVGATLLIAWTIVANLQSFTNAILWPNDNIASWYDGAGLCDVQVQLQVACQIAAPAALGCVLRGLASAMDTKRAAISKTKRQRYANYAIDLTACLVFPAIQMVLYYVVQARRYYLIGISGCVPAISDSWLTILLIHIPPVIWTLIDGYFALLILVRLCRYHQAFASILAHSNTSTSRFARLYIFCLVFLAGFVPLQIYVFFTNHYTSHKPYSWSETHDPLQWDDIIMIPSGGTVYYDRWIWLGRGAAEFLFFGLGKEAVTMYRSGLLALGFGRLFPGLGPEHDCGGRKSSVADTISSIGSKAKLLFWKHKNSACSSWADTIATASSSLPSHTATITVQPQPQLKRALFWRALMGDRNSKKKPPQEGIAQADSMIHFDFDSEMARSPVCNPSTISRVISVFKSRRLAHQTSAADVELTNRTGAQQYAVQAEVSVGQHHLPQSLEIVVSKGISQGSERAGTRSN